MAQIKKYVAVDCGAESGRVMLGTVSADAVELEEVHRFDNGPIEQAGSLRWDFDRLFGEITCGIGRAVERAGGQVRGIGIDTWGVDFGLIGSDGRLIENPYHYRDGRTDGMMDRAFELLPKSRIYENTGLQFMQLNTVYQLLSMRLCHSEALAAAKHLLFMPDLFAYYLSGSVYCEYTIGSTSQLMDMRTGEWSKPIFDALNLPMEIMPRIVRPGTIVGQLSAEVQKETGCGPIPVIAVGAHDTACAVAAVPAFCDNWAYFSCGTWSLIGVEVQEPCISDQTFEHNFTNEGGVEGTIRLLKNVMGLWLVQECRRCWQKQGVNLSYPQLTEMAGHAERFCAYLDPNDSQFLAPGEMPNRVNEYLQSTGQSAIVDKASVTRVILEGLAFRTRWVIEKLEQVTARNLAVIHMVGGGIQNELLCQFVADATGRKVITGPVEATACGNILTQARATGQIESLAEARDIVRRSFQLKTFEPQDVTIWDEHYRRMEAAYQASR